MDCQREAQLPVAPMEEVFERSAEDDLIAEVGDTVKIYPENMGISGRELFGMEQYEEE